MTVSTAKPNPIQENWKVAKKNTIITIKDSSGMVNMIKMCHSRF